MLTKPSLKTRAYIYRCLVAGAPIAATYGAMSSTEIVLWLALAATVLGNGLAAVNTQPPKTSNEDGGADTHLILLVTILLGVGYLIVKLT